MYSLFKLSAYQRDDQARPEDVVMEASYPEWVKALAFTAIRRSVQPDTEAWARTLTIEVGDVKGLLRVLRSTYERTSVQQQHRLMAKLRGTLQSDYKTLRSYIGALEANFVKLTKIGITISDVDKRYFLLEGLSEEFRQGVSGNIYSYESPHGLPADYMKAVSILTAWDEGRAVERQRPRETAMATSSTATQVQPQGACVNYLRKGVCRWGTRCRYQHVQAPGREQPSSDVRQQPNKRTQPRKFTQGHSKRSRSAQKPKDGTTFNGICFRCGRRGHKKTDCKKELMRCALGWMGDTRRAQPRRQPIADGCNMTWSRTTKAT